MKMRSPSSFPEAKPGTPRRQRGDVLLEALVAVLITSIIGAGTAYMTSRLAISAKDQRLEGIAAQQMRELLQRYGATLCDGGANHALARLVGPNGARSDLHVICHAATASTLNGMSVPGTTQVMLCTTTDPVGRVDVATRSIAVGGGDQQACGDNAVADGGGTGGGTGNGNGNGNNGHYGDGKSKDKAS